MSQPIKIVSNISNHDLLFFVTFLIQEDINDDKSPLLFIVKPKVISLETQQLFLLYYIFWRHFNKNVHFHDFMIILFSFEIVTTYVESTY